MICKLNLSDFQRKISSDGFYLIKDFLSSQDLNFLKKNFNIDKEKEDKISKINFKFFSILSDIKDLNFDRIKKRKILSDLFLKYELKKIAEFALNSKIKTYHADYYFSPVNPKKMVIPWHTDQAYSGKKYVKKFVDPNKAALKFFFYLTDVDSDNGCLGYIPGSHKISYFLKKLILEKKISYSPYWHLEDYRNFINNLEIRKKLDLNFEYNEVKDFIENSSFILSKDKDTNKFDIHAKAGSLLIFDESGVHRGSAIKKLNRKCIRFFFKR